MTQQVRVVQKGIPGRDTTEGKLYEVIVFTPKGEMTTEGVEAVEDSYAFIDDVGDTVTAWLIEEAIKHAVFNGSIFCGVEIVAEG